MEKNNIDEMAKAYPNEEVINWKDKNPTLTQVKKISDLIKKPIAFFLSNPQIKAENVGCKSKIDKRTLRKN